MISPALSAIILVEVVWTLVTVYCLVCHEQKFVKVEKKIAQKIKSAIRKRKIYLCSKWLAEQGVIIEKEEGK